MVLKVIDVETTGLPGQDAEVIEIASVDLTREFGITNEVSTFVQPLKSIPAHTSAVHGIIDDDVKDAPFFGEAVTRFRAPDLYLIAHQAKFERYFLGQHLEAKAWICTLKVAKRLWPGFKSHSNMAIRYELGLIAPFGRPRESINAHRAGSDCIVTASIVAHILQNKLATFAQLLEWSEAPEAYTHWPSGKHKGVVLGEVPADYLQWSLKTDMDDDIKAAARAELERRVGKVAA
jgi:exodeoxyribonuclease X